MQQTDRFHALDALRAFALLLGIVLHASLSFLPGMGERGWLIVDNSSSNLLGAAAFVIHMFRMTVFFLIAGFFARMMFHRQGANLFFRERAKRILIPLVAGWLLLMPLMLAAMVWGARQMGKPLLPPSPPSGALLPFPLTHLWFLWVLFLLYLLFIGARWLVVSLLGSEGKYLRRIDTMVGWMSATPLGPVLLALPLAISLHYQESWRIWEGIPTPDRALVPNLPALLAYGTAFAFGWLLHRQTRLLRNFERHWQFHLSAAFVLTGFCMVYLGRSPSAALAVNLQGLHRTIYIAGYCLAVWCWTLALTGAAMRFLSAESAWRRYLSDASYWIYLVHLPLILALQALTMRWNLHWVVKFAFIMGVAIPLLLLSYRYFVRPTWLGVLLNGRRYPRSV